MRWQLRLWWAYKGLTETQTFISSVTCMGWLVTHVQSGSADYDLWWDEMRGIHGTGQHYCQTAPTWCISLFL